MPVSVFLVKKMKKNNFLILILLFLFSQSFAYLLPSSIINNHFFFGLLGSNSIALIILIVFFVLLFWVTSKTDKKYRFSLIIILSGIISNIYDRITFGGVRDYINIPHWPVFNLADSYIVLGIMFILYFYFIKKELNK